MLNAPTDEHTFIKTKHIIKKKLNNFFFISSSSFALIVLIYFQLFHLWMHFLLIIYVLLHLGYLLIPFACQLMNHLLILIDHLILRQVLHQIMHLGNYLLMQLIMSYFCLA